MKTPVGQRSGTVAAAIEDARTRLARAGIDDARLEAEVLLSHVLGIDRTRLLTRLQERVEPRAASGFAALLGRRSSREPLAYVVGHREFYGINVTCGAGALIPRPETEMLVDVALDEIAARGEDLRVADVGTGSGAIAVAIATRTPAARIMAIDRSGEALELARRNALAYRVESRIEFREADLLEGSGEFDVIVANLPYVSEREWRRLPPEIRDHEPREALVGGLHGTEAIARLLASAPEYLARGGLLACEIGAVQGPELKAAARRWLPDADVDLKRDMAGLDRVLLARRG